MNTFFHWLAPAVALSIALLSAALAADPTDAKAPTQPLRYQSVFADYKPWRDIKPGSWRELNDSVAPAPGKTGGHARLREARRQGRAVGDHAEHQQTQRRQPTAKGLKH